MRIALFVLLLLICEHALAMKNPGGMLLELITSRLPAATEQLKKSSIDLDRRYKFRNHTGLTLLDIACLVDNRDALEVLYDRDVRLSAQFLGVYFKDSRWWDHKSFEWLVYQKEIDIVFWGPLLMARALDDSNGLAVRALLRVGVPLDVTLRRKIKAIFGENSLIYAIIEGTDYDELMYNFLHGLLHAEERVKEHEFPRPAITLDDFLVIAAAYNRVSIIELIFEQAGKYLSPITISSALWVSALRSNTEAFISLHEHVPGDNLSHLVAFEKAYSIAWHYGSYSLLLTLCKKTISNLTADTRQLARHYAERIKSEIEKNINSAVLFAVLFLFVMQIIVSESGLS